MNRFASVLTSATERHRVGARHAREGDGRSSSTTRSTIAREDVVEATVRFDGGTPKAVRVVGPDGERVPAQVSGEDGGATKILFVAKRAAGRLRGLRRSSLRTRRRASTTSTLKVSELSLENKRYVVTARRAAATCRASSTRAVRKELLLRARAARVSRPRRPTRLAGLEHGLGRPAEAAARDTSGARADSASSSAAPSRAARRGRARERGLEVRPDDTPLRR